METAKQINYNRAKTWQIGSFAFNNTATNVIMLLMGYVSYYATGVVGLSVVLVSSLLTSMRMFDAITDPIIGFIIEYFIMNKFDIIWIVFLVIDIIILFVNLIQKN